MDKKRSLVMAGGTFACALAIGFVMQSTSGPAPATGQLAPVAVDQAALVPAPAELALDDISLTSALPDAAPNLSGTTSSIAATIKDTVVAAIVPDAPVVEPFAAAPADPVAPNPGCGIVANAVPADMAQVDLNITAPCFGNARVTVHHNGMMFTDITNSEGVLTVSVPALNDSAVFIVEFDNGKAAVAMTDVPDLHNFERVVVQWSGNNGFQVHAREFGATYGQTGHVWSGMADQGATGTIQRLGDPNTLVPQLAEIYTFPRNQNAQAGTVALTVETEVTAANCGRDVAAQSLELRGENELRTRDLVLSMPNCSAVGDFLVLNNLVEDLKIAAK